MDEKDKNCVSHFERIEYREPFRKMGKKERDEYMKNIDDQTVPNTDNTAGDDVLIQQKMQPENAYNSLQQPASSLPQSNVSAPSETVNNYQVPEQQIQSAEVLNNLPHFRTSEIDSHKNKHQYIPMVWDNLEACVTFVAKLKVDSERRLSMKDYSKLSQQFMNSAKCDTIDIGRIYVVKAMDYGTMIMLEIYYLNAIDDRKHKEIYVDKGACSQGKLYDEFLKNEVHCFNTNLTHKMISEYMYKLILSKMDDKKYCFPKSLGFSYIDNKLTFVTNEYCQENGYPIVTKTFKVDVDARYTFEAAEIHFAELMNSHNDKMQFLLLSILRVTGLLSYVLSIKGIRFNRIVFINGDSRQLSKYLQIYDKASRTIRPYSINVKTKDIKDILNDESNCVVMFEDKASDSSSIKKNGVDAINFLCDYLYDINNNTELDVKHIITVFSNRLGQIVDSKCAINLDFSAFKNMSDYGDRIILLNLYILDDHIVKRVCSNERDFYSNVYNYWKKYSDKAQKHGIDPLTLTCLMIAYHEIVKQYRSVEPIVSEEAMAKYLIDIIKKSDKIYNNGSVAEEFKTKLNQMIVREEIELVENSEMNNCFGSSGNMPVVFYDDNWLYFPKETFEYIVSKMALADNGNAIRKSLDEEGILKTSDALTYKVTLYDIRYNGRTSVTAVDRSVLKDEALSLKRGGMFNYEPCTDNGSIERIPLGTDEKGRTIYWSIGHKDIGNTHLLVNGSSGMGKTTAVNEFVKGLYTIGKHIIYVDFSNSDSPEQLEKTGIDKEYQENNCCRIRISECISNEDELESAMELLRTDNPILIFEADKYDNDTETFLSMLYHKIKADSNLSVFLVIDEAYNLDHKKGSAIYTIMEEGRKNGISLISIFQGPHETKPKQYSMMNQAALKLVFEMNDLADAKSIAEANLLKPPGKFIDEIMDLKMKNCLVIGKLENSDGKMMNKRFVKIEIDDI